MSLVLHLTKGGANRLLRCGLCTQHQVRTAFMGHEYFKEKAARAPILYRYGYKDKAKRRGMLPRGPYKKDEPYKDFPKQHFVPYNWGPHKAQEGQNDYIDIFGDGDVKVEEVSYGVPEWLRGFQGTEFHKLIRKRELFDDWLLEHRPKAWMEMQLHMRRLWWRMNYKWKPQWVNEKEKETYLGPFIKEWDNPRVYDKK